LYYDVVFEWSKSEKNEATPTPSRAHVIGGGGEGVCAFTGEVLWPCRPQGADYGGSNEIGKKRRVFSWWWRGSETKPVVPARTV